MASFPRSECKLIFVIGNVVPVYEPPDTESVLMPNNVKDGIGPNLVHALLHQRAKEATLGPKV